MPKSDSVFSGSYFSSSNLSLASIFLFIAGSLVCVWGGVYFFNKRRVLITVVVLSPNHLEGETLESKSGQLKMVSLFKAFCKSLFGRATQYF